jgi:signal transduction histidine kinase
MLRKLVSAFVWRVLSIPIFFKILGIGFLVGTLFGGVTLFQTRASASRILYQLLEQRSLAAARILADTLEGPARAGDLPATARHLREARKAFPDIRYLIVRSRDGHVLASTLEGGVVPDLQDDASSSGAPDCRIDPLDGREGLTLIARCPIGGGDAGTIELGVFGQMVTEQVATFQATVLWALAICVALGSGLALLLTHLLTRPIHRLEQSANRIREGDFQTRADVIFNDEIGRLAVAFNEMAASLTRYREQVQVKEKARLSLIERIVQVQEDERKSISRELHDQMGQSLLALLLQVQSSRDRGGLSESLFRQIEETIRQLIDEVGTLAGGMRPAMLDDHGLDSALARHVKEVSERSGLDIDFQCTCPPGLERLPSRVEVTLFRIAQEALANVLRHAHALHASAILLRHPHDVTLLIEDDGRGFDPAIIQDKGDKCIGLIGMKERVALLGGDLLVQSAPAGGTTIRARIPVSEDDDADTDLDRR